MERGTTIILLRKNFLAKDVNTYTLAKFLRYTAKSVHVEMNGKDYYIPLKFLQNNETNMNALPPILHLPGWFTLESHGSKK